MSPERRHVEYEIEIRPRAIRDMKRLPREDTARILDRIEGLRRGLAGDVKQLTGHTLEFRLRVGDYRVLFDVQGARVFVRRIRHRREAYSE